MKVYARSESVLSFETTTNDIGFTLSGDRVTTKGLINERWDDFLLIVYLYIIGATIVYFFTVIFITLFHYTNRTVKQCKNLIQEQNKKLTLNENRDQSRNNDEIMDENENKINKNKETKSKNKKSHQVRRQLDKFVSEHHKLVPRIVFVAGLSVVLEIIARVYSCRIWSINIGDTTTNLYVVWVPLVIYIFPAILLFTLRTYI